LSKIVFSKHFWCKFIQHYVFVGDLQWIPYFHMTDLFKGRNFR
jgi:hypothetical protein